jgi:HK97 family phage portal protein
VLLRTDAGVVAPARDSRIWRLLGVSANPENSAGPLWEFVMVSLLLRGNAYVWKERDRDGRVIALWPIRPDRVFVGRDPATRRKVYGLATGGDEADLAPLATGDVLHIRGPGYDPLVGWSPLRFQRDLLYRAGSEADYQRALLDNGVKLSGYLSTEGTLSPEAAARLGLAFRSAYAGAGKAGGTPVLEQNVKFNQLSMTAADAQFLQQRQFTRQEIAMILDLPAHRLLASEGGGLHYSSSQMDITSFVQTTIAPWTSRIERALLQDDDLPWTFTGSETGSLFPKFNLDVLAEADPLARFQKWESAVRAKWIMPDEIRGNEGLPPSGDPAGSRLPTGTSPTAAKPEGPPS